MDLATNSPKYIFLSNNFIFEKSVLQYIYHRPPSCNFANRAEIFSYISTGLGDSFICNTAYNVVISPYFMIWNCPKLCGNCAFPQNFHNRELGEISVFYEV